MRRTVSNATERNAHRAFNRMFGDINPAPDIAGLDFSLLALGLKLFLGKFQIGLAPLVDDLGDASFPLLGFFAPAFGLIDAFGLQTLGQWNVNGRFGFLVFA